MKKIICRILASELPVFTAICAISLLTWIIFLICNENHLKLFMFVPGFWIALFCASTSAIFTSSSKSSIWGYPASFLEKNFKYVTQAILTNLILIWLYMFLFYFPGWLTWIIFLLGSIIVFIVQTTIGMKLNNKYKEI